MSLRTRIPLTSSDIEDAYEDERWLGWGYLNGRRALTATDQARADDIVLAYANEHRWGYEQLFAWLNSRPGRHFADGPFTPGARSCLMLVRDGD